MSRKKKIYQALLEGAEEGHSDTALYEYVRHRVPKVSSKSLVRASLLALTDPDVNDGNTLNAIYALAIKHRLDRDTAPDVEDDDDEPVEKTS